MSKVSTKLKITKCSDLSAFQKTTGVGDIDDSGTSPKEFKGRTTTSPDGNKLGVFINYSANTVVIHFARPFVDGGFQNIQVNMSLNGADTLYKLLGEVLR
jgi:hypothetical protein